MTQKHNKKAKINKKNLKKIIGTHGRVYSPYGWAGTSKVMQNYKKLLPTTLTQTQIMERNYKNGKIRSVIRFGQEEKRKELVLCFHDLMGNFISAPPIRKQSKTREKKDGSISTSLVISTLSSPVFSVFGNLFYESFSQPVIEQHKEKTKQTWGSKIIHPKLFNK
jgi:hypothetical protein